MKRKSLLTLTALLTTAAFTALSLSACAGSGQPELSENWQVDGTDGNAEYLSARSLGPMLSPVRYGHLIYTDDIINPCGEIRLGLDYGKGFDSERKLILDDGEDAVILCGYASTFDCPVSDFRLEVSVGSEIIEIGLPDACFSSGAATFSDDSVYADHAVRVTLPHSLFKDESASYIGVTLRFLADGREKSCYAGDVSYLKTEGKLILSGSPDVLLSHIRQSFPYLLMEIWPLMMLVLLALEIWLFRYGTRRRRYTPFFLLPAAAGIAYAVGGIAYYQAMPFHDLIPYTSSGFAGFFELFPPYFDQMASLTVLAAVLLILSLIFGILYALKARAKRRAP